jgi:hypothetical protein
MPQLKKTYEALSGGITFDAFDSIKSLQICELAHAFSEGREPQYDFDPSSVLSRDPNEWNERYYIACRDNPFIVPAQLKLYRAELHAHIARLFRDVWAKEERDFRYWYDLERFGYQGHLARAVVRSRMDLSPFLTQPVKTQNPSKGELSHGVVEKDVHAGVQAGGGSASGAGGIHGRGSSRAGSEPQRAAPLAA